MTTKKLGFNATYTKNGRCRRDGIDYFYKEKFEHSTVKNFINWVFNNKNYRKVLVVWDTQSDLQELNKKCKTNLGIEIWSLKGIIYELSNHKITSGSRDDVLRTMELVFLEKSGKKNCQ